MNNTKLPTIGVMTSGGDAPGMNAAIRAVTRTALAHGARVLGVHNGYEGVLNGEFQSLGARDVSGILQRGGTILQTSRSKRFMELAHQRDAIGRMKDAGMDALVVIGGEGSLNGAYALHRLGFKVVGIPGSIDNDVWGTDICIGTDTAINTIMDAVDKLRDTAASHRRAFLIETMGRNCGYLATMTGIVCGAEVVLIPEVPITVDDVGKAIQDAYRRGKNHAIVINSEGSGHDTANLAKALDEMNVGFTTRVTILGHIQRGGSATAFDRVLASRMGSKAVDALLAGKSGVMTALNGNRIEYVPLKDVIGNKRIVALKHYEMSKVLSH
jgi:6-phosphofructokinase 1